MSNIINNLHVKVFREEMLLEIFRPRGRYLPSNFRRAGVRTRVPGSFSRILDKRPTWPAWTVPEGSRWCPVASPGPFGFQAFPNS